MKEVYETDRNLELEHDIALAREAQSTVKDDDSYPTFLANGPAASPFFPWKIISFLFGEQSGPEIGQTEALKSPIR